MENQRKLKFQGCKMIKNKEKTLIRENNNLTLLFKKVPAYYCTFLLNIQNQFPNIQY